MNGESEHPEYTVEIVHDVKKDADKKTRIKGLLSKKRNMTPDTFDFSISKDGNGKKMILRIADGRKEVTLSMDQNAVITLMAGLMDTATDIIEIERESKTRDVMYA